MVTGTLLQQQVSPCLVADGPRRGRSTSCGASRGIGGSGSGCLAGRGSWSGWGRRPPGAGGRLAGPARVTVVSAPAGSGKTVLLRSWIRAADLAGRAGWVATGPRDGWPGCGWRPCHWPGIRIRSGSRPGFPVWSGEILSELTGQAPAVARTGPRPLTDPLSESELRVLRYLPTNLTAPEIAGELSVSRTRSRPTCATCTQNSARIAGLRPLPAPATWACWRRPPSVASARAPMSAAPGGSPPPGQVARVSVRVRAERCNARRAVVTATAPPPGDPTAAP
jgi:hypothetical protein